MALVVVGASAVGIAAMWALLGFVVASENKSALIFPAILGGGGIAALTAGLVLKAENPATQQTHETRPSTAAWEAALPRARPASLVNLDF